MTKNEDETFRHLAASVMAQDMIVQFLMTMWLKQLPPPQRVEIADGLRAAIRRTETLTATSRDEFHAEFQADVAVLAQAKLDAILANALGSDAAP